jgi:ABC-type dipeptide/oligopeptide/nickel transport system ATPase component
LQNPHSAFNPVFKVGYQVIEPLLVHLGLERKKAFELAKDVFRQVGISEPDLRLKAYPHELSGGMKQRAVISVSILMRAKLIIADEPTTALDPTVESQILKLLRRIIDEQRSSMIFISHDISQVGWIADKIAVMYGGWIVEIGKKARYIEKPLSSLYESTS